MRNFSRQLFITIVICCASVTTCIKNATPGYHFDSNRQKANLSFMDDLKFYASNEKSLESLSHNSRNKYMGNFITRILCWLSRLNRGRIRASG